MGGGVRRARTGGWPGSLWIAGRASNGNDTDALTLRLDADGNELFRSTVAGTEQRDDEHYDLVVGPPGHATVAGVSAEIDESYNFQAIRYVTSPLDVDYDGEAGALRDGILIQRWLFDFHGAVLETGAVDTALCVRCPAETIDVHLSAIVKLLDVDGNGASEALTDGTLISGGCSVSRARRWPTAPWISLTARAVTRPRSRPISRPSPTDASSAAARLAGLDRSRPPRGLP